MPSQPAVIEVAVPRPLRRTFDYVLAKGARVPAPGTRVRVPLGRSGVVGIVLDVRDSSPHQLKMIEQVIDDEPLLPPDLVELARWLAGYYHHPIGDVLKTVMPVKARRGAKAEPVGVVAWQLAADTSHADTALARAPTQRVTFDRLRQLGSTADAELAAFGIKRQSLAALLAKELVERTTVAPRYETRGSQVEPTREQATAIAAIIGSLGSATTYVLEGVTGSGKTEVYLRVIAEVLRSGKQALVLVPEIALTPQTTARFAERFGATATLHSGMTDPQRFDTWLKCRDGSHKVLIGTRSAVLAPFADLGVIVVDEEHDGSFKQQEGLRYSARDVAVKRGQMLSIPVVLGSATPSMETLENARRDRYRRLRLTRRVAGRSMPGYRISDIRGERLDGGIGMHLHRAIGAHLDDGNQVLAFINRRGYAPVLLCSDCGWQAECDHCDVKLTYHRQPRQLRCHHCDRRRPIPRECPSCGARDFVLVGTGTQRTEETLRARHPGVPLYRIDRDTTRSARRLEADLAAIAEGKPAILVGTQMLAKGHHLPNVTLVAVLDADGGFLSPDFRAPERTAQLIVQVAGRAGRGERPGEVWIQTFDPGNANLRALIEAGYPGFVGCERQRRESALMPPFVALAIVRAECPSEAAALDLLRRAAETLSGEGLELLGPAPAPIARRADRYRSQLLLLARRRRDLHLALDRLEQADPRARGVRWSIDVDPLDTA
ncbi:MAG: primosomal protein N' [Gammaproteobacteria bacterium]|nr:primosomal protein N' [Gammaproteobacteria bacterium]